MSIPALQAIQADLIAAAVEIAELQSHFQMKDADFAVLRDHLDAIGRKVEEMGEATSSDRAGNTHGCAASPALPFPANPQPTM